MRETAKRLSRSALCSAHNNRRRQRSASPSRLPAERKILTAKVARLRTTLGANGVWVGEGFCAGLHSPAGSFCPVQACASQPNGALVARHFFWQTTLTVPEFLPSWTGRLCGNDFMKNDDMGGFARCGGRLPFEKGGLTARQPSTGRLPWMVQTGSFQGPFSLTKRAPQEIRFADFLLLPKGA